MQDFESGIEEKTGSSLFAAVSETLERFEEWCGTWAPRLGFWLLCAISIVAAVFGASIATRDLEPPVAFSVGLNVVAVPVAALLYYGCCGEKKSADKTTRLFMLLLFLDGITDFLDLRATFLVESGLPRLALVDYTAFKITSHLMCYQFWRYIYAYLGLKDTLARRCDRVMRVSLVLFLLLPIVNLFVPVMYRVDAQGLQPTEGYLLAYLYYLVLGICATMCLFRAQAPLRSKLVIALFYVFPMVTVLTYLWNPDAALPDVALLSILLMYVVLVTARFQKLAATQSELDMAASIQANALPRIISAFPERGEFDIYATMDPAKEVGGDFYDFFLIDDDHLGLVVADVSGKGIPAALFMMTAKTLLKTQAQTHLSPENVLQEVNASLTENNGDDMFVTVWLGVLELSTGVLTYADAGHEKLLLYQDGAWKFLPKINGVALAMWDPEDLKLMGDRYHFHNETVQLRPGDAIFQYTDGVTEATDAGSKLFGDDRLLAAMNSAPSVKPKELLAHVREKIDKFVKNAPQFDDITMLGLQYKGNQ